MKNIHTEEVLKLVWSKHQLGLLESNPGEYLTILFKAQKENNSNNPQILVISMKVLGSRTLML